MSFAPDAGFISLYKAALPTVEPGHGTKATRVMAVPAYVTDVIGSVESTFCTPTYNLLSAPEHVCDQVLLVTTPNVVDDDVVS